MLDAFKKAMAGKVSCQACRHLQLTMTKAQCCKCLTLIERGVAWCSRPWVYNNSAQDDLTKVLDCAGLKIPKFDVTEHVKKVDTEFDPLLKSAAELEAFSQKRSKEIQEEIKGIDAEMVQSLCPVLPFMTSCECMLTVCSDG